MTIKDLLIFECGNTITPRLIEQVCKEAESAESALSLLTAKLAQCEEKLAKQEQIERLTAAHAKALEDGKRMDWLESVRFITSRRKHPTDGKTWLLLDGNMTAGASIREAIDAAMKASAPATTGKGGAT